MVVALAIVGVVMLFGLIIWTGIRQHRAAVANLQALSMRLGLETVTPATHPGELLGARGKRRGRSVRFWTFHTGSGKSRKSWVAVGAGVTVASDFTFNLRPQGWATNLAQLVGAREANIGDPAFDAKWFLESNRPDLLVRVLGAELRGKLSAQGLAPRQDGYRLAEGFVRLAERGHFADAELIRRLELKLDLLIDLAASVDTATGARS